MVLAGSRAQLIDLTMASKKRIPSKVVAGTQYTHGLYRQLFGMHPDACRVLFTDYCKHVDQDKKGQTYIRGPSPWREWQRRRFEPGGRRLENHRAHKGESCSYRTSHIYEG